MVRPNLWDKDDFKFKIIGDDEHVCLADEFECAGAGNENAGKRKVRSAMWWTAEAYIRERGHVEAMRLVALAASNQGADALDANDVALWDKRQTGPALALCAALGRITAQRMARLGEYGAGGALDATTRALIDYGASREAKEAHFARYALGHALTYAWEAVGHGEGHGGRWAKRIAAFAEKIRQIAEKRRGE